MSWTRRSWLTTTLAAAVASVLGLPARAAADPTKTPRRRPRPQKGGEYKTRWIGHY